MSTTPPPLPRPPGRRIRTSRRRLLWFGLSAVLVLVIWNATWHWGNHSANRRLVAEAHQKGELLTLAELQAKQPAVADLENAAVPLLDLWQSEAPEFWSEWRAGRHPSAKLPDRAKPSNVPFMGGNLPRQKLTIPLDNVVRSAAAKYLEEQGRHLSAVKAAIQRPKASFPADYREGLSTLLPHLLQLRHEARLFRLEALLATDRGDATKTISAIGEIVRVSDLLAEEPTMIGQLVRVACAAMAVGEVERLFNHAALTAPQLDTIEQLLVRLEFLNVLSKVFINERALALGTLDLPMTEIMKLGGETGGEKADHVDDQGLRFGESLFIISGLRAVDKRLLLETFARSIELTHNPSPQNLQELKRLFASVQTQVRSFPPKVFSRTLLPALDGPCDKFGVLEAIRRAALLALAVERHRLIHGGALPQRLAELDPQPSAPLLQDPLLPRPLKFVLRDHGYVVYSVGADRTDDGGRERPLRGPVEKFDETFTVER